MSENFNRGQETFLMRLFQTLRNTVTFVIIYCLITLSVICIILYKDIPLDYWKGQQLVHSNSMQLLKMKGFLTVPESTSYFLKSTTQNFLLYRSYFRSACIEGITGGFIIGFLTLVYFFRRGVRLSKAQILRGSNLITAKKYNQTYVESLEKQNLNTNPFIAFFSRKTNVSKLIGNPFYFGKDRLMLPEEALFRHMAVLGTTGVGKTTLINEYLDYCREKGEKVIIPDINGEYAQRFFRAGDVILSLTDQNTAFWDFNEEPIPHEQFADFLVPTGSEQNAFWWKGSRAVLSQLIRDQPKSLDLWEALNSQKKDLVDYLSGLARKISGSQGSGQSSGIAGSTVLDLGFLEFLNYWPRQLGNMEPFSVYRWAQDPTTRWVFITFTDSDRSRMGPIMKIWINLAILGLFEREKISVPALNLVIDELASIGQIELLPTAVERARKYRGKVILGYQTASQLKHVYGMQADSIKTNTSNKFIFRTPDPADSKDLADFLGRSELILPQFSSSYGQGTKSERENMAEQRSLSSPILDSELRALPDGHFYLRSLHMDPVKSCLHFKARPSNCYKTAFQKPIIQPKANTVESAQETLRKDDTEPSEGENSNFSRLY